MGQVRHGCAPKLHATVVGLPTPDRAILDAGSKAPTSDLMDFRDFGGVCARDDARVYKRNEEHGHFDISRIMRKPKVGDAVEILRNDACPVANL
jgi:D-serine deaminase-like pyridoxal phosphate-dependent protein